VPEIAQGTIPIQVIASGYQTLKMNSPKEQYSAH
jgi:hypothetical protein